MVFMFNSVLLVLVPHLRTTTRGTSPPWLSGQGKAAFTEATTAGSEPELKFLKHASAREVSYALNAAPRTFFQFGETFQRVLCVCKVAP